MTLAELGRALAQHGVILALTAEGKLKPTADQQPPGDLVDAIRAHRAVLVRRLERSQHPDGRLNVAALQDQPGRCASCGRWQGPDEYGDGLCLLGRAAHGWPDGRPDAPVLTTALHECAAYGGKGWKAVAA